MSNIYTHISLTNLRRECGDLDELLISAKDIEFNELLGEGIFLFVKNLKYCLFYTYVAINILKFSAPYS